MPDGRATVLLVSILLAGASSAFSNGIDESMSWKFDSSTDTANKANIAAAISRERAGNLGPGDTNITYNVKGNLNNCNLNATAIGNTGSNTQDAPIGSPSVGLDSAVTTDSRGNDAQNTTTGGSSSATNSDGGMVESAQGVGSEIVQKPVNSTALNSTQANTGSQLSTVGSVANDYAVAGVYGTGGSGQANLNATQTVANTDLVSSVQGSSACDFQEMNGNLASPINAVSTMSNQ